MKSLQTRWLPFSKIYLERLSDQIASVKIERIHTYMQMLPSLGRDSQLDCQ